jgi:hypothetical protein
MRGRGRRSDSLSSDARSGLARCARVTHKPAAAAVVGVRRDVGLTTISRDSVAVRKSRIAKGDDALAAAARSCCVRQVTDKPAAATVQDVGVGVHTGASATALGRRARWLATGWGRRPCGKCRCLYAQQRWRRPCDRRSGSDLLERAPPGDAAGRSLAVHRGPFMIRAHQALTFIVCPWSAGDIP